MRHGAWITVGRLATLVAAAALLPAECQAQNARQAPPSPEQRAVSFLAAEVPRWRRENACYSCHNNGDAVRALVAAKAHGLLADTRAIDDSLEFLAAPRQWDANGPDGPFKDKQLARIQFAAALGAAAQGRLAVKRALAEAAPLIAELQQPDGSWQTDAPGSIGSPVTYGQPLATALAVKFLVAADSRQYASQLERARDWIMRHEVPNVLDAAATLWALGDDGSPTAAAQRTRCLNLVRAGEARGGGWGPYVNAPPQVFDTALVTLALAAQRRMDGLGPLVSRGRTYLLAQQAADGSWPATTRPSGADSYAQQISTSGWATLALLATSPAR